MKRIHFGIGCLVILALAGCDVSPTGSTGASAEPPLSLLPDTTRHECRKFLQKATDAKLVLARPSPNRVNVDESSWALISAENKSLLLRAVSCDIYGQNMPSELNHVVAYGYRSGKRLAMLTQVGVNFE